MLGLFSRPHRRPQTKTASRLRFERLEARDCPATGPQLTAFNVSRLQGHNIIVSGHVNDLFPATCTVHVTGVASDIISVDANGDFSDQTVTTGFGQINGQAFNALGLRSRTLWVDYQNLAPTITYQVQQSGPYQFTVSGVVTDEDPNLATVVISGAANGNVSPDINGNYSFTFTSTTLGSIGIQARDQAGQLSLYHTAQLVNNAPVITSFSAHMSNGWWVIEGNVSDESPEGLVVYFHSGIGQIESTTATVGADGHFSRSYYLKNGMPGSGVSAQVWDWFGLASNIAYTWVGP